MLEVAYTDPVRRNYIVGQAQLVKYFIDSLHNPLIWKLYKTGTLEDVFTEVKRYKYLLRRIVEQEKVRASKKIKRVNSCYSCR